MNAKEVYLEYFSKWVVDIAKADCFVSNPYILSDKNQLFLKRLKKFSVRRRSRLESVAIERKMLMKAKTKEDDADKQWETVMEKNVFFVFEKTPTRS